MVNLRMRYVVGHVAQMGEKKIVDGLLVEKPEENRPVGRPSYRWEDNI
jgi:hypothetical protein